MAASRSTRSVRRRALSVAAVAVSLLAASGSAVGHTLPAGTVDGSAWVGTWEMAPSGKVDNGCRDCTIRDVVHTSVGGRMVRVHVSNVFGTAPLVIGDASVALPETPDTAQVAPGTLRRLTFAGQPDVTIPAGATATSDPVLLDVPADHDLLVTTFTPGYATPMTFHPDAQEDSYFTRGADAAQATTATALPERTQAWHFVTAVDVAGSAATGAVVAFGDSITDGYRSAYDVDHRWPNFLAGRLLQQPPGQQRAVLDAGIGGNRVLLDGGDGFGPAALARFHRDVVDQAGARAVIVLEGINDIQQTPHQLDPSKIIEGLQELADQAHSAGLRVIGGTLTPFEGWQTYDAQEEATRQDVNDWIRNTDAVDAVADFDAAVRDPADPHRMRPVYDSGDHLHPNDIGYAAMADAVDLATL